MRFFDTEAYTADCSDVMVWTVTDLNDSNGAVNDLRETRFWSVCFTIEKIIPASENECAKHYNSEVIGEGLAFRAE